MNRKLIIAVTAVVVVLGIVAGAAVTWFFFLATTPEEAVAAAADQVEELETYGFRMDMTLEAGGQTIDAEFTGSANNADSIQSAQLTMDGSMALMGQEIQLSEIMTGGVLYMKYSPDPLGAVDQWYSVDFTLANMQTVDPTSNPSDYLTYMQAFSEVERVGSERIDGVNCTHYHLVIDGEKLADMAVSNAMEISSQLPAGSDGFDAETLRQLYEGSTITMELYIGSDGMPRRQEMVMEFEQPIEMTATVVMDLFDFNIPVTIEAPANAVPMPTGYAS